MPKFRINHSCGHSQVRGIYGKKEEQQPRADWLADQPCSECTKRIIAEAKVIAASESTLATLTGTDRHIAWASEERLWCGKVFIDRVKDACVDLPEAIAILEGMAYPDSRLIKVCNIMLESYPDSEKTINSIRDSVVWFAKMDSSNTWIGLASFSTLSSMLGWIEAFPVGKDK